MCSQVLRITRIVSSHFILRSLAYLFLLCLNLLLIQLLLLLLHLPILILILSI